MAALWLLVVSRRDGPRWLVAPGKTGATDPFLHRAAFARPLMSAHGRQYSSATRLDAPSGRSDALSNQAEQAWLAPPFTSLCGRGARQGQAAAAVRLRAALTRTLTRPRILPILLT